MTRRILAAATVPLHVLVIVAGLSSGDELIPPRLGVTALTPGDVGARSSAWICDPWPHWSGGLL